MQGIDAHTECAQDMRMKTADLECENHSDITSFSSPQTLQEITMTHAIETNPTTLPLAREYTPLELMRHRIRKQIRARMSADPQGESHDTAAMILLYNWARELPGTRGFTPLKRTSGSAGEHPSQALIRLIGSTSSLKVHLESVMHGETPEDQAIALRDFRTWSMAIARGMLVDQFNALPAGAPGLQALLARISTLTPHGASNAQEHGREARAYWHAIVYHLRKMGNPNAYGPSAREGTRAAHIENVKLPTWAQDPKNAEFLLKAIDRVHRKQINTYLEMHDCGKAFCLTTDENGKNHYPNHAEVSAEVWAKAGGAAVECELMRKDMLVHTASAGDCSSLACDPLAPILLLSALAEIHANATPIFSGFESDSFKIKFKQIERRGSALLKTWLN